MIHALLPLLALALPASAAGDPQPTGEALTADDCVALALRQSAEIEQAEAKVQHYEGVLAEVEANYWPKLMGLTFIAPMYTVTGDVNGDITKWDDEFTSLRHWGPYAHVEALLAQPLYTFGRVEAGKRAASERIAVERARVRETELAVALEVRRLYYMRLYALSLLPALDTGLQALERALAEATDMYDEGEGEITQADLGRLGYGLSVLGRLQMQAVDGAGLALSALKHTMGVPQPEAIELAEARMPRIEDDELEPLDQALIAAAELRPEWHQIRHGREAAEALEEAELLAMTPVLFVAGQIRAAWAPTRDDAGSPYVYDPYNDLFGGVALGLQFNIDPANALAKAEQAEALQAEIDALARFAATGIPLRVKKAHDEVARFRKSADLAHKGVKAAQKWMTFSGAAYYTGTGEAKDLLEGLVAWLQAKEAYYATVRDYYIARAELDFAVGR